MSNKSHGET